LYERVAATAAVVGEAHRSSRFELARPRHFVLPAILLLLSEEPSYGYRLAQDLEDLKFGAFDRPVVYRALSQLEDDALVESLADGPEAGRSRRMYGLTPLGAQVLQSWMTVIQEKRDALDGMLQRYQSTPTIDAVSG
jgi:DNA-binding PadR family transcriptional regulator